MVPAAKEEAAAIKAATEPSYDDDGKEVFVTDKTVMCGSCGRKPLTSYQVKKRHRCNKCADRAEGKAWSY
jgi:uncharacterized CHY-type Zn-finger protein